MIDSKLTMCLLRRQGLKLTKKEVNDLAKESDVEIRMFKQCLEGLLSDIVENLFNSLDPNYVH